MVSGRANTPPTHAPKLLVCNGWSERSGSSGAAPGLLVESAGRLRLIRADGRTQHDFGAVGNVPCPLALAPDGLTAFRYCCETRVGGRDYSEIRRFDLRTGTRETVLRLKNNQWVLWQLTALSPPGGDPAETALLGLIASDETDERGLLIQHRLFVFDSARPPMRLRPLCRDAFFPLAIHLRSKEMLFHGAEGIHRVGLDGNRIQTLPHQPNGPLGRGADYVGDGEHALLGGGGIWRYRLRDQALEKLFPRGHFPRSCRRTGTIWFSTSTSDLWHLDPEREPPDTPVVALAGDRHGEISQAQAPALSPCGRYVAAILARKKLRGVSTTAGSAGKREPIYHREQTLCLLDTHEHALWQIPGEFDQALWLPESGNAG